MTDPLSVAFTTATIHLNENQVKDVLTKAAEQANPGFVVKSIRIRDYQAPGISKVEIDIAKIYFGCR